MSFDAAVHAKAIQLDQMAMQACAAAGSGHPSTALSLGHIATVLLYHTMRWVPEAPRYPTSDRLVLSEGHAVPIIYAAGADLGVSFGKDPNAMRPMQAGDLNTLRAIDSALEGHPNPAEGFPFFDAATGSLGQGLSVAAGLAIAARTDGLDKRIYCICGDGESREGQIWEACDFIVEHGLTNVLPIFNCNKFGQSDAVSEQQSAEKLAAKLRAFGFEVFEIDGHAPAQIKAAFDSAAKKAEDGVCCAVVAKTVKGWGVPSIQSGNWHGKPIVGDKLRQAEEELNATRVGLTSALAGDELRIFPPAQYEAPAATAKEVPSLPEAMKSWDMTSTYQAGRLSTRKAFGLALRALGQSSPAVWALDADVKNSTFTEWFANDRAMSDRFVECRIAEQNMASVAVGLSAAGKIPFFASFGKFITRAYDQIEMGLLSGANLKVVGSHVGITPASDGPSQMALPDVAWFRSLSTVKDHRGEPGCYVLQPADAFAAYALTVAAAEHHGMCYLRVHRPEVEFLYDDSTEFELGSFEMLTEGRDLMIVSAGYMLHECNKAIEMLDKAGVDATLIDLYSLPFDRELFLDIANKNGGNILTVEDNFGGGIGSAVSEACTDSGDAFTIVQMTVDRLPKSARTEQEQLEYCGLHAGAIATKAAQICGVAV
ncbi:MAG: transketolase [Phycisphaerales bacterium]|jgi:transketolase